MREDDKSDFNDSERGSGLYDAHLYGSGQSGSGQSGSGQSDSDRSNNNLYDFGQGSARPGDGLRDGILRNSDRRDRRHSSQQGGSPRNGSRRRGHAASKNSAFARTGIFIAVFVILCIVGYFIFLSPDSKFSLQKAQNAKNRTQATLSLMSAPASADIRTDPGRATEQILLDNVYETLVGRDENNKPAAGIAKSWEISADGLAYSFHLNENMCFSSGRRMEASDVVQSIHQITQNAWQGSENLENLASVENPDPNTVEINLYKPNPQLLWFLSGRAGIVYDLQSDCDYSSSAAGSGPYKLTLWQSGSGATFEFNENYYGKKPAVEKIAVKYSPDENTAIEELKNGTVDAIIGLEQQARSAVEAVENAAVYETASCDKVALAFNNNAASLMSDQKYRLGFQYLTDRHSVLQALSLSPESALTGPVAPLDPGYEDLGSLYGYDYQTGRSQIGRYVSKRLKLVYPAALGGQIGQAVSKMFAQSGIIVDSEPVSNEEYASRVLSAHNFDITIVEFDGGHDLGIIADPSSVVQYDSPAAQEEWQKARYAPFEAEYEVYAKNLARIIKDDSAYSWLYVRRPLVAAAKNIKGLPRTMAASKVPFANIEKQI